MDAGTGRHRKRDLPGLVTAGLLIALGIGFLAGMGTDRFLLGDADDRTSTSSATTGPSPTSAPGSAPPQDQPPDATAIPAPADPAPPGPQGAEAYLARLADDGLPVEQHRETILVLGRVVCEAPPSERADEEAVADRVAGIAGDLLTREQTLSLVRLAAQELCGA